MRFERRGGHAIKRTHTQTQLLKNSKDNSYKLIKGFTNYWCQKDYAAYLFVLCFCTARLWTKGSLVHLLECRSRITAHMNGSNVFYTARGKLLNKTKRQNSRNMSGRCSFRKPRTKGRRRKGPISIGGATFWTTLDSVCWYSDMVGWGGDFSVYLIDINEVRDWLVLTGNLPSLLFS